MILLPSARRAVPPRRSPAQRRVGLMLSAVVLAASALPAGPAAAQRAAGPAAATAPRRSVDHEGDYIVAVVNQESVTHVEVEQRIARIEENASRSKAALPPTDELHQQVLDALIDERVLITYARDSGARIDDVELDRAVSNVAVQNQITLDKLKERLKAEGTDFSRFRDNIRDQLMMERTREREVQSRIHITDAEIDAVLDKERAAAGQATEYNIAQILVTVPENASPAVEGDRRARAVAALARVQAGESFEAVNREMSEDSNKDHGGTMGMRASDRLPDLFVAQVRGLKAGDISTSLLRSGAGFHILKLVDRRDAAAFTVNQTHARHILLKLSDELTQDAAVRRLTQFRREIESGSKTFEQLARDNSQDNSAPQGGDLDWVSPGNFVPEFEEAMNKLAPGGLSEPVVSRFGVHLIQVIARRPITLDVKQQREQARNILRERKFEEAYADWIRDLRARAYVEMREAPLS